MADWKNKDFQGTFANGEGPVNGQSIKNETENSGLLPGTGGGTGHNLKTVEGATHGPQGSEEKGFSLSSPSYRPSNSMYVPEDKGTKNPFDLGK